jgi:serine/threonine-protein kinase
MSERLADDIPTQLGRFQITGLLGKGSMGVVYKAHDPNIDRIVAIKLIRAELLGGEGRDRYLTRFRNEARAAGRCVHPNIIGLYDFALHEGRPYLVLEYVDGLDLRRSFPLGTPVDPAAVRQIALQVLDALEYAHGFGIIHRDVKPANILLTTDGRLKVTDFGIARFAVDETQTGLMVGTPSYMSPEQCRGVDVDKRCDLFSLGCVLYELSCGERAFTGDSYAETLYRLINEPHIPLTERNPAFPPEMSAIIDRALAKHPDDRFASAKEMAAALRQLGGTATPAALGTISGGDEPPTEIVSPVIPPAPIPLSALMSLSGSTSGTGSAVKSIDADSLPSLERHLAGHLGPMAGYHLKRAMRDAQSTEEFHRMIEALVPEASPERTRVLEALARVTTRKEPAALTKAEPSSLDAVPEPVPPEPEPALDPDAVTDDFIEKLTGALAHVMGPIAPRLVARARAEASTRNDLTAACAAYIDHMHERAQFEARLRQGGAKTRRKWR